MIGKTGKHLFRRFVKHDPAFGLMRRARILAWLEMA